MSDRTIPLLACGVARSRGCELVNRVIVSCSYVLLILLIMNPKGQLSPKT
jgi:hypothetical protein